MADVQYRPVGTHAAPNDWTLPSSVDFTLKCARASFDGTGAAAAWLPALEVLSDAGNRVGLYITPTSVAAGASADVSFFPWSRHHVAAAGTGYQQVIDTLRGTNQLIALWRLNEGSTPYADTAGYRPADPANASRQILAVPMTQNFTPAMLSSNQDAFAVGFNADFPSTGAGDWLQANAADESRFSFTGTAPYSLIAWVRPFSGVSTSLGGVIGQFHLTGWAPPAGTTDGWMLGVNQPAMTPYMLRYPNIAYGGVGVSATGAAISAGVAHMIAGTYDGANLKIYTDGVLAATQATVAGIPGTTATPQIGQGQDGTATSQWFYGAVGEVSVWGSALTAGNIAALYTAGTT